MRTGRYSLAELFGNRHIEQLVIPEIQRDYVWETKHVNHLLRSILDNFNAWLSEKKAPSLKVSKCNSSTTNGFAVEEVQLLQNDFAEFYSRRIHSTNIGFVYAYCDSDLPGQYYLIDGQQRITTLYLTLLAVASSQDQLKKRFCARYCLCPTDPNSSQSAVPTKLDYRLREHTSQFLHRCVDYFLNHQKAVEQVKEQSWFLERFQYDPTSQNLVDNFKTIKKILETSLPVTHSVSLYEYLEDLVECWYFDTNESTQGEELYLYLNARGESIAENENIKAQLLEKVVDINKKNYWGRLWEDWQDYFWNKRTIGLTSKVSNPNADRGFNSFLSCIENLQKLRNRGIDTKDNFSLEIIEYYFKALRWLDEKKSDFKALYNYADWVESWFEKVWNIFNQPDAVVWKVDLNDKNEGNTHNQMVLVWGSLLSVICALEKEHYNFEKLDKQEIFRAIRIFYLQFHNYGRKVVSLPETVAGILNQDPNVLGKEEDSTEERTKWMFLKNYPETERRVLESVIWKIEDHPLNLKGRNLGNVNLTHLLDLKENVTGLPELERVCKVFYELFPLEQTDKNTKILAAVLLYYGNYWNQENPWYYDNFNLGNMGHTIRGKGNKENTNSTQTVFRLFFNDFIRAKQDLNQFLASKENSVPVDPAIETDLRKALIWYSEKLKDRLFEKGMFVATKYGADPDARFPKFLVLWNTQGDFKGYRNQKLADLV